MVIGAEALQFAASLHFQSSNHLTNTTSIANAARMSSNMDSSRLLDPVDAFYKTSASGRRRRDGRSTSRRSKSHYKKLLWFKQPCQ